MRSMLVIGLGRFGRHLAIKLVELGNEVMVVDTDEDAINKMAPFVTRAQIGDCMDEDVLKSLGVSNFDVCFVCISDNFQSSLEITSLLKELHAPCVISKTDRDIHAKFLLKIGADDVIYPERDMAQRAAVKYSAKNTFDYVELTKDYAITEMSVPNQWAGKTVLDLNIRSKYNINILGFKNNGDVTPLTDPHYVLQANDHLVVAGNKQDVFRLMDKK
ncbi:TrkA family potassium uptake protein [Alkalibacter rhizosphaerae]|uniref:TrkA family potassium uptake protein n=1 Tax=Alkalibacter rhizosphaerae TaxID=2815577 RepID=A0A974XGR8_9FIRM|nr:TrkA family potassium uptake protein [Alkalibacter rhizosphaerae]QSX09584.1 TrkA family potassium uptake protein [Alkalibacter rhizosphaerae]